ncbi:hypothetical protein IGI04_033415, partial [Brassica rapa subsp. trilocularis]
LGSYREDRFETRIDGIVGEIVGLFGVFDADAYNHTDCKLLKSENSHTRDAGSTASTAILVGAFTCCKRWRFQSFVRFLESKTANIKASNISSTHASSSQKQIKGKPQLAMTQTTRS